MTSAMANTPPLPCYIIEDDREVRFALYITLGLFSSGLIAHITCRRGRFQKPVPRRNNFLATVTLSTTKKQSELTGKRNEQSRIRCGL